MIRHIVCWKLLPCAEGKTALENGQKLVSDFQTLKGKIPGLLSIESGLNLLKNSIGESDGDFDLVLDTTFPTKEALDAYQIHPLHQEIVQFVKKTVCERRAIDFEF